MRGRLLKGPIMLVISFDYDNDLNSWIESEDKEVKFVVDGAEVIMDRKCLDVLYEYNRVMRDGDYDLFMFMEDMEDFINKVE